MVNVPRLAAVSQNLRAWRHPPTTASSSTGNGNGQETRTHARPLRLGFPSLPRRSPLSPTHCLPNQNPSRKPFRLLPHPLLSIPRSNAPSIYPRRAHGRRRRRLRDPSPRIARHYAGAAGSRSAVLTGDRICASFFFFFVCVSASVRFSVLRCLPCPTLGFCLLFSTSNSRFFSHVSLGCLS